MKIRGRIIAILCTLLIMAISLLLALQAFGIVSLYQSEPQTRLLVGVICLGVFLLGAVFLYFELRLIFSGGRRFLMFKDDLGKVEINERSIGQFIDHEARLFGEISETASQIVKRKDGLHIKSRITVGQETGIAELGEQLQNHLKHKLESDFGLLISGIEITAKINQNSRRTKRVLE